MDDGVKIYWASIGEGYVTPSSRYYLLWALNLTFLSFLKSHLLGGGGGGGG